MTEKPTKLAALVQGYFCGRLVNQQNVSPHTISAYRDTFRLLYRFFADVKRKRASNVELDDIDVPNVLAFLDYLERVRHNAIRTRNARLAAIRSFLQFAAAKEPSILVLAQRVLAIPMKRYRRPLLGHLERREVEAIISAPDQNTWSGRRDRAMLLAMYNTGARVSEVCTMKRSDMTAGGACTIKIHGKGRKERSVPLWRQTATCLRGWTRELADEGAATLFPNARGGEMSRSGVEYRLEEAVEKARAKCPSLAHKHVSPHTIRHTTAMHLLQAGVDMTVIALWLGHESCQTTHQYVEANIAMKEKALARVREPDIRRVRKSESEDVLRFLESL